MTERTPLPALLLVALLSLPLAAQDAAPRISEVDLSGLELRGIGPAINGGRIADIDLHPEDPSVWYVAVGSGGVWKTENAGTTWTPVFDDQSSYSIGSVTIDPSDPSTVWVGTGENVGGRHVGYGDGIYRSTDGGRSWEKMGLEESEHLSTIVVHPEDSDVVWVSAQGPLWSSGGQRGLYKTTDGGETWRKVLGDDEWTGVTDVVMDPRDPDRLYAATWQRHRTVAAYMGGGPGSGLHRSTDGGESWEELSTGLPGANMGKIGLAISPQDPDRVYAAITLERRTGGVWMSADRGSSWTKMSDAVAGGTGPHYYQELYASPHQFGRLYLVSYITFVSDDHGASFEQIHVGDKHVDDHAIAFRPDDPDYLLFGSDGGLYESFDLAESWRFVDNLPVMQYYKVAVDDAEPFYHVYGGTQDNGSNTGPSRTDHEGGIRNADWYKTLGADGHDQATEPGNPDIHYAESQEGVLRRIDRSTGDQVLIQPQPREGEDYERFNWDAPVEVSFHDPRRIYHASHRVWRSDDRGDSWTPISGDLTRDQDRITLPIMGKQRSWDNPWDVLAMSNYNTITSIGESPLDEETIWVGTDDGLIHVTGDGGESWRRIEVGEIEGVPATAFVNDVKADLHDPNTVYVALDDHKNGDFSPYLVTSSDRGRSWTSLAGDLPDRHLVWRVVQDHEDPELLFAATEFGLFFTTDGGGSWTELDGGAPTIAFRDAVIQREREDLVLASFGRGMFVLDDYTPLRELDPDVLEHEGALLAPRTAWWYEPDGVSDSQGADDYRAENPPFGAVFTYHLRDGYESLEAERAEREADLDEAEDVPFPGWDALESEMREQGPEVQIVVRDTAGTVIDRVEGPTSPGVHRVAWDLRHAPANVVGLDEDDGWWGGFPALPGRYTATLVAVERGEASRLSGPVEFEVVPLREGALERASDREVAAFREVVVGFQRELTRTSDALEEHLRRVEAMQTALDRAASADAELERRLHETRMTLLGLQEELEGSEAKAQIGEKGPPTPGDRLSVGLRGLYTTYGPTELHRRTVEAGRAELTPIRDEVNRHGEEVLPGLEQALEAAGAPPVEGGGSGD